VIPLGNEMILLVEDDDILCHATKVSLESFGYTVVTAGSSADAIHLLQTGERKSDLLLTDVVMPVDAQIYWRHFFADMPRFCMC